MYNEEIIFTEEIALHDALRDIEAGEFMSVCIAGNITSLVFPIEDRYENSTNLPIKYYLGVAGCSSTRRPLPTEIAYATVYNTVISHYLSKHPEIQIDTSKRETKYSLPFLKLVGLYCK